jgi:hypothetical protein
MTGDEIYHNFTEGPGGGDLSAAAGLIRELQDEHEQEAAEIRSLAVFMESAWQGEAAGAAERGAVPLAVGHEQSAPVLFTDQDLISRQAGSFGDARHRVVPVPPAPEMPPGIGILFQPGALPTYQRQLAEHTAAAESNVDVMTSYEDASAYNTDNLPSSYEPVSPDAVGTGVSSPHDGGAGPRERYPGGPGGADPNGPNGPPAGGGPSPAASPSGPVEGGVPPQGTTAHGNVAPSGAPASVPVATEPISGRSATSVPGGLVPGAAGGFRGGSGADPGGRGVSGSPGAGGEASRGVRGRAGLPPVAGGAAAETAARGPAGARGGAAGGVPVGAGAARGRGAEDEDYERKTYLEGGDPDDLYGVGELTASSVIGEED